MELEELGLDPDLNQGACFSMASELPWDKKVVKKWGTSKDHPKCVK